MSRSGNSLQLSLFVSCGRALALLALVWLITGTTGFVSQTLHAQTPVRTVDRDDPNPPPPVPPATIARDDHGHATVRAIRLTEPLRVDGRLDEAVYRDVPPVSGFIQTVPNEGQPASEKTDAWVMFDAQNLYLACRCWDSAPPDQWTANEMRRDTSQLRNNDVFGALLDTFHDRRNGFNFYTNPLGARADQIVTDEGNPNTDWNPVWFVRTGRFDGGWTVEMAIPFKSIRYQSGRNQTWGIQIRRAIRRKNEWTHLTFVPASTGGATSIFRVSAAADLVGLDLPPASKNVELKPYAISSVTTDRSRALSNSPDGSAGLDFKYGVTANLTADVTLNTDFAQVEVDEQQVNLTRFSLSYPEKRDFFLEGRGLFDFGKASGTGNNNAATPTLFYSRRIGLNAGRVIPIDVGTRLTGKAGRYGIGAMNIQTGDDVASGTPTTNFTVVRLKRDILRRSNVGVLFTNRSQSVVGDGQNQAYGVDSNFNFYQNVSAGAFYAKTQSPGLTGDDASYDGRFDYGADRYGARAEYLVVGNNFNPEVGLVRRKDFKRTYGELRFSPRPRSIRSIRQFTLTTSVEYIENGAGQLETRTTQGHFGTEFENSDVLALDVTRDYEFLVSPFRIATDVTIPVGGYRFSDAKLSYSMGQQRRLSGQVFLQRGHFYDGTITAYGFTGARLAILDQWSFEPSVSINDVKLQEGDFTTALYRIRSDYAFSPLMFVSALLQYSQSDHTYSSNLRFRWEYRPGSEMFIVYTDERDTAAHGLPGLRNRAFVFKINRLMRF
jgi:Domain of unknown function (DUF5916)